MQRTLTFLMVTLCAALAVGYASAATIQLSATGPLGELGFATSLDESAGNFMQNADGTQSWVGAHNDPSGWEVSWDLLLDPDPFVSGVIAVKNNTGNPGTFMAEVLLPVSIDLPSGSIMMGSSAISVNDSNNSGAATLSAPAGGSIYEGRINGVAEATLFDDPYSLSPAFPPTTNVDIDSFSGTTSVDLNTGGVMSLKHTFVLTAGDSATGNSNFTIIPIPEPASIVLIVLGSCFALIFMQRRK